LHGIVVDRHGSLDSTLGRAHHQLWGEPRHQLWGGDHHRPCQARPQVIRPTRAIPATWATRPQLPGRARCRAGYATADGVTALTRRATSSTSSITNGLLRYTVD